MVAEAAPLAPQELLGFPPTCTTRQGLAAPPSGDLPLKLVGGTMPHPIPVTFYRTTATAGAGSAAVLLVNAAKRTEIIPTTAFTQLVAPLAQIFALALVTALYFAYGRRAGTFGLAAYLLNGFALSALVGVEFVINLVFNDLPKGTVDALRDGPLGIALTVASIAFLLGTLAFVTAMIRGHEIPRVPLALYAAGAVPVAFRAFVPERPAPSPSRSGPSYPSSRSTSASSPSHSGSVGSRSGCSPGPVASGPGRCRRQLSPVSTPDPADGRSQARARLIALA
jgi:hypothetical protein